MADRATVLDARDESAFEEKHIGYAKNVPVGMDMKSAREAVRKMSTAKVLPSSKSTVRLGVWVQQGSGGEVQVGCARDIPYRTKTFETFNLYSTLLYSTLQPVVTVCDDGKQAGLLKAALEEEGYKDVTNAGSQGRLRQVML